MQQPTDSGRRQFLSQLALGALAVSAARAIPAAQAKVDKQQAQYQEGPKGDQKCANCTHYQAATGKCTLVTGNIQPQAWCALYAPASGT